MARNPAGSGTIRKKTVTRSGRQYTYWEARYTAGYDPATGRQVQKSITGKTQKEVARKLKEATTALDHGVYTAPRQMTLAQWLEIWQETYLVDVKESTRAAYRLDIRRHIVPALGPVRLDRLDPHMIQGFVNGLDLSPATVKKTHAILHAALQQAYRLGYLTGNPADLTTLPRMQRREMSVLDEDATARFLDAAVGDEFELLFRVDLFTGLRLGELLGLTWKQVDFTHGTVLVDRQLVLASGKYSIDTPKNGRSRTLRPAPYVMQLLRTQRRRQTEQRLKAGELWSNPWDLVFTNEAGGHLTQKTVSRHFKRIAEGIGLPDLRFHDLRHSYAVAALRAGDDVKTVQGNLGHASAAFTLDRYGHVTDQMKQASADRMENYVQSLLKER